MIQLELPEAEWLTLRGTVDMCATAREPLTRVPTAMLQRLLRDHTKLVERLKTEIDWCQVLPL